MSRTTYYQAGAESKYHAKLIPGKGWVLGLNPPYMFGRGWRKFRKHRFEP